MPTTAPVLTASLSLHLYADAVFHAGMARKFRALAAKVTTPAIKRECQGDALRHERRVRAIAMRTEALLRLQAAMAGAAA